MEKIPNENSPQRVEEFRNKFLEIHESIDPDKQIDLLEDRMRFGKYLSNKYEKAHKYALYHVLIGSTIPNWSQIEGWDFPKEDSIETFMESLISKYSG